MQNPAMLYFENPWMESTDLSNPRSESNCAKCDAVSTKNHLRQKDSLQHQSIAMHKNISKVGIMKYQIGKYDFEGVDDLWKVPSLDNIQVKAIFFVTKDAIPSCMFPKFKDMGWNIVLVDKEKGTENVCANRLTAKRVKWTPPEQMREFDLVISHDCDTRLDYEIAIPYFISKLNDSSSIALLQKHYRGDTVFQHIDRFLFQNTCRVTTSRNRCLEWRKELLNMSMNQKFNFGSDQLFLSNILVFRPNDSRWLKMGRKIFEKCHFIQRDQFILPWALQSEKVNFLSISRDDLDRFAGFKMRDQPRFKIGTFN